MKVSTFFEVFEVVGLMFTVLFLGYIIFVGDFLFESLISMWMFLVFTFLCIGLSTIFRAKEKKQLEKK